MCHPDGSDGRRLRGGVRDEDKAEIYRVDDAAISSLDEEAVCVSVAGDESDVVGSSIRGETGRGD